MKPVGKIWFLLLLVLIVQSGHAQKIAEQGFLPASANFDRQRFNVVILGEVGISTLAAIGLEFLWYKKFPKSRFHFFNDNNEWLNMDKVGHATSAYNIAAVQYNVMRWTGVNKTTSLYIGIATALGFMSMIEISDGFSKEWGFSPGDMIANIGGTAMFGAQQSIWHEQKILMQFSYHNSIFSKYNPDELGRNLPQRLLKDYNGQSYWLSFNISSFMGKSNFPKWITANLGYGASGMISAVHNPSEVNGKEVPSFTRERKLFLGVTGSFTANNAITYPSWLNILKIPAPVAQWNLTSNKISFNPLYY